MNEATDIAGPNSSSSTVVVHPVPGTRPLYDGICLRRHHDPVDPEHASILSGSSIGQDVLSSVGSDRARLRSENPSASLICR